MATRITRSNTPLVPPTHLNEAFADPRGVVELIEKGAPYKTEVAVHKHPGVELTGGWFRNFWALGGRVIFDGAEEVFHNPTYINTARWIFKAEVVRPVAMMTNLNLPMAGLPPHLDLPFFRGAMNREVPSWMLEPMGYSGLFQNWAVPVASAISWFYDGAGGEFEFWPRGMEEPSKSVRPPFYNLALMADNEYTYHRVGPIGNTDDHVPGDAVPYHARLALTDDRRWEVQHEGEALRCYDYGAVRLSVLWKAYCFSTAEEARAYDDHSDDLAPELITDLFLRDLAERGVAHAEPSDPLDDLAWKETLLAAYPTGYVDPSAN